jgi:hypothetical protein
MVGVTPLALRLPEEAEVNGLAERVSELGALDLYELRVCWRKLTRTPPPDLPRHLMLRLLAYKLQARLYGDLDAETVRYLRRINRERLRRRDSEASQRKPKAPPPIPPVPSHRGLKPGTVFAREFGGAMHRVTVVAGGFSWKGERYASLSEIARLITGTRWNGPRFFGLREREIKAQEKPEREGRESQGRAP